MSSPEGTGTFVEANSCSPCPVGTFTSVLNDETSCQLCDFGKSSTAGSSSCELSTNKIPDGCLGNKVWHDRSCHPRKALADWMAGGTTKDNVVETYGRIENWDMSLVTDISHLFRKKVNAMNADLSSWDVSSVTNMHSST